MKIKLLVFSPIRSGKVTVTRDLSNHQHPLHYTLGVSASNKDFYNGPFEFSVVVEKIREEPHLENLDTTVVIPEDRTTAGDVFQVWIFACNFAVKNKILPKVVVLLFLNFEIVKNVEYNTCELLVAILL